MSRINRSAQFSYSVSQIYRMVADVEAYPEFLPWCTDAKILHRDGDSVEASLELSKGGFSQSFSTRNTLMENRSIEMSLLKGPFSSLHGIWRFEPQGQGCRIELEMNFRIDNPLLKMTVGAAFDQAMNKLVDAFAQRAKTLYG